MIKKKGVSDVIATILIILLVLAAIIIVWQVVSKIVKGGAIIVEEKSKCIDVSLDFVGRSVKCNSTATNVIGSVSRGADNVGGINMKLIIGSNVTDAATTEIPNTLASKEFKKTCVSGECDNQDRITVKVAPVVGDNKDVICDPTDEVTVTCAP